MNTYNANTMVTTMLLRQSITAIDTNRPWVLDASACLARARGGVRKLILAWVGALLCGSALADLSVFPTRIVFEGSRRAAEVDLVNPGAKAVTYRLSMVQRRMTENGEFVNVEAPVEGERFADALVRFSPRQIELAPGGSQVVRLMLRKPANLEAGEYRSHLMFEEVPEVEANKPVAPGERAPSETSIRLTATLNITIPVIVRHGETAASVKLSDLAPGRLPDGKPSAVLRIERAGNRSVYGDLIAYFTPAKGAEREVGRANGVVVYAPYASRKFQLALATGADGVGGEGKLRVVYVARPEDGGKFSAEAVTELK
jgi:P pilus assembly chaperone PapD